MADVLESWYEQHICQKLVIIVDAKKNKYFYTFQICQNVLFDEKLSTWTPMLDPAGRTPTLKCEWRKN